MSVYIYIYILMLLASVLFPWLIFTILKIRNKKVVSVYIYSCYKRRFSSICTQGIIFLRYRLMLLEMAVFNLRRYILMLKASTLFNLRRYILMLLESLFKNCVISLLSTLKKPSPIFFILSPKETLFRGVNLPQNTNTKKVVSVYIYSCY